MASPACHVQGGKGMTCTYTASVIQLGQVGPIGCRRFLMVTVSIPLLLCSSTMCGWVCVCVCGRQSTLSPFVDLQLKLHQASPIITDVSHQGKMLPHHSCFSAFQSQSFCLLLLNKAAGETNEGRKFGKWLASSFPFLLRWLTAVSGVASGYWGELGC